MENTERHIFAELPEALVEEMLSKSEKIGERLYQSLTNIQNDKANMRKKMQENNLLKRDNEFGYPETPTTCGIDGSYAVDRLLAVDLVACGAVALEGLTPPSEKRHWEKPHHQVFIHPEKHNQDIGTIIRGIMMGMELELAVKAPHDIVFIDGSFTTPLIYLNQAINKASNFKSIIGEKLRSKFRDFLDSYITILRSDRTDKLWISLPKYTTRREVGEKLNWPDDYDDRAILTSVLEPGEVTSPIPLERPSQPWHLRIPDRSRKLRKLKDDLLLAVKRIHVMYYKPHNWTPALRIEIPSTVISNKPQIGVLLDGIRYQSGTPGIFEPYPLYIADRMVKHLGSGIPAFRQTATKQIAELHEGDVGQIFFDMHGYRTESGR